MVRISSRAARSISPISLSVARRNRVNSPVCSFVSLRQVGQRQKSFSPVSSCWWISRPARRGGLGRAAGGMPARPARRGGPGRAAGGLPVRPARRPGVSEAMERPPPDLALQVLPHEGPHPLLVGGLPEDPHELHEGGL